MSEKWELNEAALNELLSWLDSDCEQAGRKYETIRAGLVKMLSYWAGSAAEELADKTINRVAIKVPEIRDTYKGDPSRFFYGVAKHVFLEHQRIARREEPFDEGIHNPECDEPTEDHAGECMESCMKKLTSVDRELVRRYFEGPTSEQRERLAKSLGTTKNALAVRVYRIREPLKKCFSKCMRERNAMK
jgi:DNA-directed RNA polymerase specialized sigma24 family protein